jgi:dTMP kinase
VSERRGKLIALEGIDASGKATQTALLKDRIEAAGLSVRTISFPRYGKGFFADLIERYLRGEFAPRAGDVSPYLAALPYAADRWQAASILRGWLEEGCVVLCNRYVAANLAHQGSKLASEAERAEFYQWDLRLEHEVLGLPRPALQVLLEVPTDVAAALRRERDAREGRSEGHDIHEADLSYLRATAAAYREVAARTPGPWAVVQCAEGGRMLPADRISAALWDEVRGVLYNREVPNTRSEEDA